MPHTIFERVRKWSMEDDVFGPRAYEILNEIEYHAEKRFHEYHPTFGPRPEFRLRLRDWLNNSSDESDQKKLLELVHHIFFAGITDFNSLHRAAYQGPITRWLIDKANLSLTSPTLAQEIGATADETWFCPITDSMQIAAFYHINNITGRNERPDWHSLSVLGDIGKITTYMNENGVKRLVLLEDFVGSGSQMLRAIRFAMSIPDRPILFVPMIICPVGFRIATGLATYYSRVEFAPVLPLTEQNFVSDTPRDGEQPFYGVIRELVSRLYTKVSGGSAPNSNLKPYGPYGFAKTGALTVMYTNCPDNTLPLIHHASSTWRPLFPRSTRI